MVLVRVARLGKLNVGMHCVWSTNAFATIDRDYLLGEMSSRSNIEGASQLVILSF